MLLAAAVEEESVVVALDSRGSGDVGVGLVGVGALGTLGEIEFAPSAFESDSGFEDSRLLL